MEPITIRRKGQITLPSDLRKELNLHEGDVIYFQQRGGETILVRAEDIVARTAGALAKYAKGGPLVWDRDELWGEITEERTNRFERQVAEVDESYDSH